uniref:SLV.21 n=1 Tax=Streptomyces lavendulae TaxID=1914 RepID=Q6RGP9_STRLA|nr:SLV.21 [Streptomyces lavendulae]
MLAMTFHAAVKGANSADGRRPAGAFDSDTAGFAPGSDVRGRGTEAMSSSVVPSSSSRAPERHQVAVLRGSPARSRPPMYRPIPRTAPPTTRSMARLSSSFGRPLLPPLPLSFMT